MCVCHTMSSLPCVRHLFFLSIPVRYLYHHKTNICERCLYCWKTSERLQTIKFLNNFTPCEHVKSHATERLRPNMKDVKLSSQILLKVRLFIMVKYIINRKFYDRYYKINVIVFQPNLYLDLCSITCFCSYCGRV
jgi:hypothetical protein